MNSFIMYVLGELHGILCNSPAIRPCPRPKEQVFISCLPVQQALPHNPVLQQSLEPAVYT